MPRGTRQSGTERMATAPLVSSRRGKFRALEGCELEAEVHEKLGEYKQFVREVEGEEPTDGAICSAALEMLFAADEAFVRSQESGRRNARHNAATNGAGGANGAAATADGAARGGGGKEKREAATAS